MSVSTSLQADTTQGQLGVRLVITQGCYVNNGAGTGNAAYGTLDFGTHSSLATAVEAQSTGASGGSSFSVTCNNSTNYNVELDSGLHSSGSTQRNMTNGTSLVAYNLYQDSGRTTPFGTGGSAAMTRTGTGSAQEVVVYGRVPVQTVVPTAGTYTDTVQVTVTW